ALQSACQHIQAHHGGQIDTGPLVKGMQEGPVQTRLALLGMAGVLSGSQIRETLRGATTGSDPKIRAAAFRTIWDSQEEQLLPDILKMACAAKENNFRMLGIHGCIDMISREDSPLTADAKLDALKAILGTPLDTAEKRLVLSGLGTLQDQRALSLATPLL